MQSKRKNVDKRKIFLWCAAAGIVLCAVLFCLWHNRTALAEQRVERALSVTVSQPEPRLAQEDNLFHAAVIEQSGFGKLEEIWKSTNVNNLAIFCAGRTASYNGAEYRQSHQLLLDSYRTGNVALIGKEIVRHYSIKSNKNIEDIFAFPQAIG